MLECSNVTLDPSQNFSLLDQILAIIAQAPALKAGADALIACVVRETPGTDAGVLWLYDSAQGRLEAKAAEGYTLAMLGSARLASRTRLAGSSFVTDKEVTEPAEIMVGWAGPSSNSKVDTPAEERAVSRANALYIPLALGDTKMGVLMLEHRGSDGFGPDDLVRLRPAATLISLYLQNALLQDEVRSDRSFMEANRLRSESLSILAHDMRTPLTAIKGYATTLLMEEVQFSRDKQREFLQLIDEACDSLVNLIHDLLESSVLDAGAIKLGLEPVLLPRLAQVVADEMQHSHRSHRLLVDFPEHFPIVEADPDRILQVLRNLLDNAVKYSPQGGLSSSGAKAENNMLRSASPIPGSALPPNTSTGCLTSSFVSDPGWRRTP